VLSTTTSRRYDIGLPDNMGDDDYFERLVQSVNIALDEVKPDFVFYDAGVDVYEHDVLGRLKITEEGIRKRDRWVIERCVIAKIPVAGVIGGGYDKDVTALAKRHAILHEEASYVWRKYNLWNKAKTID
jgi:acetoin utilization deacetylase AcuC-like enzyme